MEAQNSRAGAGKLRIETGRWRREPRTCQICVQNSIEDEAHFMLYCPMYHTERTNMFNEIMVRTEGHHDLRMMLHDPNWMLDVLIGHSFLSSSSRNAVCVAVAKYLTQAFKRRKLFEIWCDHWWVETISITGFLLLVMNVQSCPSSEGYFDFDIDMWII